MKDYSFDNNQNSISFKLIIANFVTLSIFKTELGNAYDDGRSQWIVQLLTKREATKEIAYALASEIQRLAPSNRINWEETFYAIEAKFLHEEQDLYIDVENLPDYTVMGLIER